MHIRLEFDGFDEMLEFCRRLVQAESSAPERPVLWVGPKEETDEAPIQGVADCDTPVADEVTERDPIAGDAPKTEQEAPKAEQEAPKAEQETVKNNSPKQGPTVTPAEVRDFLASKTTQSAENKKILRGLLTEFKVKSFTELTETKSDWLDAFYDRAKEVFGDA